MTLRNHIIPSLHHDLLIHVKLPEQDPGLPLHLHIVQSRAFYLTKISGHQKVAKIACLLIFFVQNA